MPTREPVASFGPYTVFLEPPTANRSYERYGIYRGQQYIGATYSFPTIDDAKFEERKRTSNRPQYAGTQIVPAHRYQQPTGKYSISIDMHRTAEKNRSARRAAMQSPINTLNVPRG